MPKRHNWKEIRKEIIEWRTIDGVFWQFRSLSEMAEVIDLPQSTVSDAYARGDLHDWFVGEINGEQNDKRDETRVEFEEEGNTAVAKMKSAEPLTKEDVIEIAGVDMEEWQVSNFKSNFWTVSAFDRNLGEFVTKYNYQTTVNFERRNRIPVELVFQPIEIATPSAKFSDPQPVDDDWLTVLFATDPHFGFRSDLMTGGLIPFHDRRGIGALMSVARYLQPERMVWGGDMLDLADWTDHYPREPEVFWNTQLASIELSWVLSVFRETTDEQDVIEGNHDERMRRAIMKSLATGYGLKPVHELDGPPMMSMERLLGLDAIDTGWVGGYPDNEIAIGDVRFRHGSVARKWSGSTSAAVSKESSLSTFFGHVHRRELVEYWDGDRGESIWTGTPGCLCLRERVPGGKKESNWQKGAFVVQIVRGKVANVESVKIDESGDAYFRGTLFSGYDYTDRMVESIPAEYSRRFKA